MNNPAQGSGAGTRDHNVLLNRDTIGQHPSQSVGVLSPSAINVSDVGKNWKDLGNIVGSLNDIDCSCYIGNGIAVIGVDNGHIWRSTDYGYTWTDLGQIEIAGAGARSISYIGNGIVICVFGSRYIARSTDFGITWTVQIVFSGGTIGICSSYLGNGIVIACNNGWVVYRSTDSGASWVSLGFITESYATLVNYLENGIAIITTVQRHVWRSTNYGTSWTDLGVVLPDISFTESSKYLGNGIVLIGNSNSHMSRSTDYGLTWTDLGAVTGSINYSLSYLGNGVVISGCSSANIYRSIDYGLTWSTAGAGFSVGKTFSYLGNGIVIFGDDSGHVWRSDVSYKLDESRATVHNDLMNRTVTAAHPSQSVGVLSPSAINYSDVGVNWISTGFSAGTVLFSNLSYLGNGILIIGNAFNHIFRSIDYGKIWTDLGIVTTAGIASSEYLGNGISVVGSGTHIWRSTDFGVTWTDLGAISSFSIETISYLGKGTAIFADGAKHIFRSINYGATWADLGIITDTAPTNSTYLENGIVIVTSSAGHLWRSTNFGAAWSDIGLIAPSALGLTYLGNGVVIVGDNVGNLHRSTDFGVTWTNLGILAVSRIFASVYLGNGIVDVSNNLGHIYRSTDYGLIFSDLGLVDATIISSFSSLNNGVVVSMTSTGTIYRSEVAYKLDEGMATVHNDLMNRNLVGVSAHNSELVGTLSPYSTNAQDIGKNWYDFGALFAAMSITSSCYLGNGIVIINTQDDHIWRSTNYGVAWIDLGIIFTVVGVLSPYLGDGIVLYGTFNGHIWRTTNYGLGWTDLGNISAGAWNLRLTYLGKGIATFATNNGHIWRSTDYGATWTDIGDITGAGTNITKLFYLDNGIEIACTASILYRSINYGLTWSSIGTVVSASAFGGSYIGNGIALIGDDTGRIFRSANYGLTWTSLGIINGLSIAGIINLGNGIVIFTEGNVPSRVFRSTDYGLTWTNLGTKFTSAPQIFEYLSNGIVLAGDLDGHIYRSDVSYKLDENSVSASVGSYLPLAGGTMSGVIDMNKNNLTLDAAKNASLAIDGGGSGKITLHTDEALDITNDKTTNIISGGALTLENTGGGDALNITTADQVNITSNALGIFLNAQTSAFGSIDMLAVNDISGRAITGDVVFISTAGEVDSSANTNIRLRAVTGSIYLQDVGVTRTLVDLASAGYYRRFFQNEGTTVAGTWIWVGNVSQTNYATLRGSIEAAGFFRNNVAPANADEYYWTGLFLSKGNYTARIYFSKNTNFGIMRIYLTVAATTYTWDLDQYAAAAAYNQSASFAWDVAVSGAATFGIKVNGKNPLSTDFMVTFSRLELEKTGL